MTQRLSKLSLSDVAHLAERPLPDAPDGKYSYQVKPKETSPFQGPTPADVATRSKATILKQKIDAQLAQGLPVPLADIDTFVNSAIQTLSHPDGIDDRQGFFTSVLAILCKIPQDLPLAKKANDFVISTLYNSLPHPPASYIGSDAGGNVTWTQPQPSSSTAPKPNIPNGNASWGGPDPAAPSTAEAPPPAPSRAAKRIPWSVRSADGSGNNTWLPSLGQTGRPYARDVENKNPLPANKLPDAGLVFDVLLKARDFVPHPNGNSAMTFAFASLVTHSLFRTNPTDETINNTTSYLDLSPLYGTKQVEQDMVRDKEKGRGLLFKDAFAEDRLVLVPPAASALLVIFSRNHNFIAERLLEINERSRWKDPSQLNEAQRLQQDEEIFQTARLVNCGHFMAMIFGDYVGGFLGLARDGSGWSMNPFDPIKTKDGEFLGRGEGNHVSVEFNLLYRWHATVAQKDIQWTKDLFKRIFPDKEPEELTLRDFGGALASSWRELVDENPRTRTFGGMKRGPDGSFNDDELAQILQDATSTPAAAYRARGTPSVLRIIEIMSIEQGRRWGVCSMNEFRQFLGLKKFDSFEEWNSHPEIANAARQLYGHIDNLELYPGIQAEDCMPLGPGSGICCGYTMTRAILGDAVALVRGDRFYTTDYTPSNLTVWGFQDCARDPNNGAYGAALPKLLMRHLPRHYPGNNIYSLFPFFTPEQSLKNINKNKIAELYALDRPKPMSAPIVVDTFEGVRAVLGDKEKFQLVTATTPLPTNKNPIAEAAEKWDRADYEYITQHQGIPNLCGQLATKLIKRYSYKLDGADGTRIDIVQNVANLVGVHWMATFLTKLPLKTPEERQGLYTDTEVFDMLATMHARAFQDVEPELSWVLENTAAQYYDIFEQLGIHAIEEAVPRSTSNPIAIVKAFVANIVWPPEPRKHYHATLSTLAKMTKLNPQELSRHVLALAVSVAVPLAQAIALVIDFYMDDAHKAEREEIVKIASKEYPNEKDRETLAGYAREAHRLNPHSPGILRRATVDTLVPAPGGGSTQIAEGSLVFASVHNALLDPVAFPNPTTIDPTRPKAAYSIPGYDLFLGDGIQYVMRAVFRLKNLRRAEGVAGKLSGFEVDEFGTRARLFLDDAGNVQRRAGSLVLVYDDPDA